VSEVGRFYESRHFIGYVELGVFSGFFKGADYEKDIVGGLYHRLGVLFGK
jgi:hypothetical protein